MKMRVWALLCPIALSVACGTERIVERPVIHEIVKTEWREVPADLLSRCDKTIIEDGMTYGEALEMWAKDRASIDACNGKLAGIKSLGDGDGQ